MGRDEERLDAGELWDTPVTATGPPGDIRRHRPSAKSRLSIYLIGIPCSSRSSHASTPEAGLVQCGSISRADNDNGSEKAVLAAGPPAAPLSEAWLVISCREMLQAPGPMGCMFSLESLPSFRGKVKLPSIMHGISMPRRRSGPYAVG